MSMSEQLSLVNNLPSECPICGKPVTHIGASKLGITDSIFMSYKAEYFCGLKLALHTQEPTRLLPVAQCPHATATFFAGDKHGTGKA